MRERFEGEIIGVGTTSGLRVVIGAWSNSPRGAFTDAMVEHGDGHRVLLAPSAAVAEYVSRTYTFDEVRVVAVSWRRDDGSAELVAGPLRVELRVGGRPALGRLLRLVPRRLAGAPTWATVIDPVAARVVRGVRTRGTAGQGRREWYGATDLHRVGSATVRWEGADAGALAPIDPPVRFGFGSTPADPSVVQVVTTIERSPERG